MSSAIETLLETRPSRAVQQINRHIPEASEIKTRGEELLHARRITLARDFTLWNINQDGEQHWTSQTQGDTVRMSKSFRNIRDAWDYCDLALLSNAVVDWYAGDMLVGGFVTLPPSPVEERLPGTDSREQAVSMFDHIEAPMWVSSTAGHGIKLVSAADQLEPAFETVLSAHPSVSKPAKQLLRELPRPLPPLTDELDGGGRVTCWPGTAVIWQAMAEMSSGDLPGTRYPHSPVNDYLAAARVWGRAAERAAVQIWEDEDLADVHRLIQEFVLQVADKEAFAINYSGRDAELEGFVSGPVKGLRAKRKAERWSQSLRRDEEFWKAAP